jgi:N-acetylmuramoyl-L-alanine amidase
VELNVQFLERGEPRADEPYEMRIGLDTWNGNLDGEGMLIVQVPVDATEAEVWVGNDEETVRRRYELQIGHLNPVEEVSGVQQRLNNLGFFCAPDDEVEGESTQAAVEAFQASRGLDPTGVVDDDFKQGLSTDHGEDE